MSLIHYKIYENNEELCGEGKNLPMESYATLEFEVQDDFPTLSVFQEASEEDEYVFSHTKEKMIEFFENCLGLLKGIKNGRVPRHIPETTSFCPNCDAENSFARERENDIENSEFQCCECGSSFCLGRIAEFSKARRKEMRGIIL